LERYGERGVAYPVSANAFRAADTERRHSSDGVDGSTRTASQCAMLVLFATNRKKEPTT
jgi:hypothetical protein